MRRLLVIALLACACGGGKPSGTTTPTPLPDGGVEERRYIEIGEQPIEGRDEDKKEESLPPPPPPDGANPCGN